MSLFSVLRPPSLTGSQADPAPGFLPPAAPRVALVGGQWAQNVGNAFFNLGGHYVLSRVFGPGMVGFHQDQPNYRSLHNKFRGNPDTYMDLVREMDIDALVLQGPVLNGWFRTSWERAFRILAARGVKVILHSAAFFKFTDTEIAAVKAFLEDYPPAMIVTRDPKSFEILKNWLPGVPKYSGIDAGFFLPRCVTPFRIRPDYLYVTFNFDRYPEPSLAELPFPARRYDERQIQMLGRHWYLGTPKRLNRAAHRSKIRAYLGDLTDFRRLPAEIAGHQILRPEHRFYPHMTHKIYRQPNGTASDEPWSYLSIYAGSRVTLSDRVHACVATLAYGNPAMLFTPSPRAALFERLGAGAIRQQPLKLSADMLEAEQEAQITWMRAHV